MFSALNSVPAQSFPLRIGSDSAPLMDRASHSPVERVDRAHSARAPENHTLRRNLISPLQAGTFHHAHATRSAESLRTMPIPQLPLAGLRQIPRNVQNILPQGSNSGVQGIRQEHNPWTPERNNIGRHSTQTGPSFAPPNVASVQSVLLRGGSSSAPQVNRAEHVPSGWVYTPPGVEIESTRYTSPQRLSLPKLPRLTSCSNNRFYPATNIASETGKYNNAEATRTARLPPPALFQPTAIPNRWSDVLSDSCTSVGAQSHVRQDVSVGINQQPIPRGNISLPPSNHRLNSSGVSNQEAIERPPRVSQPNNAILSTAHTQDEAISQVPGAVSDSVDPRPTANAVSVQSASSQSTQISAVAYNYLSRRKGKKEGRERTDDAVRFYCTEEECDKSFTRRYYLEKHIEIVHLNEKPHEWDRYPPEFGHKGSPTEHILAVQDKLQPFTCPYCGQKFSESVNLNKHIIRKHKPPTTTQAEPKNRSDANDSNQNAIAATKRGQSRNSSRATARKRRRISEVHRTSKEQRNTTPADVTEPMINSAVGTGVGKRIDRGTDKNFP